MKGIEYCLLVAALATVAACGGSGGGSDDKNATQDQSITTNEDTAVAIDIASGSPFSDTQATITGNPSHGMLSGSYPEYTYRPDANYHGNDEFRYVLTHGNNTGSEILISIEVLPVNDAPTISGTPMTEIQARNMYSFTPAAADTENDPLLFTIENAPSWISFNTSTGEITGLPENQDVGDYANIRITVSDGKMSTATSNFSITVSSNPWQSLTAMPTARHAPSAAAADMIVYLTGGFRNNPGLLGTLEAYDIATNSWQTKSPMQISRRGHTSHVINNTLYVIGGENSSELSSVEQYDIANNSWSGASSLSISRSFHSSCSYDGKIYVFGGFTEDGNPNLTHTLQLDSVEMYDPVANTWSPKATMSHTSAFAVCVVLDDLLYIIGGRGNMDGYDVYDPASDTWIETGNLPSSIDYGFAAAAIGTKIYLVSGVDNYDRLEIFDPQSSTWTTGTPMPSGRQDAGFALIDGNLYIFGGRNAAVNQLNTVDVYIPSLEPQ